MAFDARDFAQVGAHGTGSIRLFTYKSTADAIATAVASGYFNAYATQIRTGDVILIEASDATRFCRLINTANVITTGVAVAFA
jgi:hypothetical protein